MCYNRGNADLRERIDAVTSPAPDNSNEIIEAALDARLGALGSALDGDALTFSGGLIIGVDDVIRAAVEQIRSDFDRERLVMVLDTPGGYIEVVQRIVETLRYHYAYVDFIIPNSAYSAGTVLAMSGDAIYMNYYSRLGPIDPQVNANGNTVPALGYLVAWDRLLAKARRGELTNVEAQLMLGSFDQAELYKYEQARELSVTLLREWLASYKFRDWAVTETRRRKVTARMKSQRAEEIARELNNIARWHSHGRGISMEVLRRDLRVRIDDYDKNPQLGKTVKDYYNLFEDYRLQRGWVAVLHCPGRYMVVA